MGSVQSSQERSADPGNGDEDNDEDDDARLGVGSGNPAPADSGRLLKKLLQQEPEILPCHAPATPLSAVGTPRLSPSIKVWDPCHVLSLVPPPHPFSIRPPLPSSFEIVLVAHGECGANLRPDLIGGRWPAAMLTAVGCRQARGAGGVFEVTGDGIQCRLFLASQSGKGDCRFGLPGFLGHLEADIC